MSLTLKEPIMTMHFLAEESPFVFASDEQLDLSDAEVKQLYTPDWGTDPMEILMAKQERQLVSNL